MRDKFLESMFLKKLEPVFDYKIEVFVFKYTNHLNITNYELSVSLELGYNSYVVYEHVNKVSMSDSLDSLISALNNDIRLISSDNTSFQFLSDQFKSKQIHLNGAQRFYF